MNRTRTRIIVELVCLLVFAGLVWWLSESDEGKLIVAKVTNQSINCMPTMSEKGAETDTLALCEKAKQWGVKIAY